MTSGLVPEFALLVTNLYAPPGTSIPMAQASPPLGWISSPITDTSFRYNSSSGAGFGGSIGWSSWNGGGIFNANAFTLSIAQLPPHSHSDAGHAHGTTDPGHHHQMLYFSGNNATGGAGAPAYPGADQTLTATTGVSINTGFANLNNTGSGAAITPNYTTPSVKYLDHILAVKS
jgi:hypothetical protein